MSLRERVLRNAEELRRDSDEEPLSFEPSRAADCEARGLAIRFAFGFVISLAVSGITELAGYGVGGLFLAFPAILPASLTLIAENDGERKARVDAAGAIIGAFGLIAFAVVSWALIGSIPVLAAQVLAAVTWGVVAVSGYLLLRRLARGLRIRA
jgi:hypothetical protein